MDTNRNGEATNFETDLQSILTDYLTGALSGNINQDAHTFHTREPIISNLSRPHMRPTRIDTNRIINDLQQNITLYNNNINLYLRIIQQTLQADESPINREQPIQQSRPSPAYTYSYNLNRANTAQPNRYSDNIWTGLFSDRRNTATNRHQPELFTNLFQNVIVRPTAEELDRASEIVAYSSDASNNFMNHRCPISLEEFQDGDQVRRINHCGHIFNEVSFQHWFHRNVRCPVCRFDVRETPTAPGNESDSSDNSTTNEVRPPIHIPPIDRDSNVSNISRSNSLQTMFNDIADELSSSLTSYVQSTVDPSNNTGFRLEIPIQYTEIYDGSNNLIRRDFN